METKTTLTELVCRECRHSFTPWFGWLVEEQYRLHCRKALIPAHTKSNPVTGTTKVAAKYEECLVARIGSTRSLDRCGEDGRHWQPKYKHGLFKLIAKG